MPLAAPVIDAAFGEQIAEPNVQQLEQMANMMNVSFEQQIFKA